MARILLTGLFQWCLRTLAQDKTNVKLIISRLKMLGRLLFCGDSFYLSNMVLYHIEKYCALRICLMAAMRGR